MNAWNTCHVLGEKDLGWHYSFRCGKEHKCHQDFDMDSHIGPKTRETTETQVSSRVQSEVRLIKHSC